MPRRPPGLIHPDRSPPRCCPGSSSLWPPGCSPPPRSAPAPRSISAVRFCRSCRTIASTAMGPTRRTARRSCGSTMSATSSRSAASSSPASSTTASCTAGSIAADPKEIMPPPSSNRKLSAAAGRAHQALDRAGGAVGPALGAAQAGAAGGPAPMPLHRQRAQSDRRVRPGPPGKRKAHTGAGGEPHGADPPAVARPDRPAADARGGGRIPGATPTPDAYDKAGRPPARLARLRRAHGLGLARRRPLRRLERLPGRQRPDDVALARLGGAGASTATCPSTSSRVWQLAGDLLARRDAPSRSSPPPSAATT